MLGGLILILILLAVVGSTTWASVAARKEWQASWRGHRILLRNYLSREELFVDGKLVARHAADYYSAGATLVSNIQDGDRSVPILASIEAVLRAKAEIYVDGERLALSEGKIGELAPVAGGARLQPCDGLAAVPRDTRWRAVDVLLRAIRSKVADGDQEVQQLCDGAERRIRALLLELERVAEAVAAHQDLGAQQAISELQQIHAAREADTKALLAGIQQLHIAVERGARDSERAQVLALLSRVTAESELARAGLPEAPSEAARLAAAAAAASSSTTRGA